MKCFVSFCAVLMLWVKMAQSKWVKTRKILECPIFGKCGDLREADLLNYETVVKCFCFINITSEKDLTLIELDSYKWVKKAYFQAHHVLRTAAKLKDLNLKNWYTYIWNSCSS